ncbi:hypothetical protein [Pseudoalteromonas rubra]|nr:hypothetical protein [Pseudoalteromonas rubra]MEC4091135.1 hypothetical protein [Pseudoalteromonas rubra]
MKDVKSAKTLSKLNVSRVRGGTGGNGVRPKTAALYQENKEELLKP